MIYTRILKTVFDGYERKYLLDMPGTDLKVWAYSISHDKYIESGISNEVIDIISAPTYLVEWVTNLTEDIFEADEMTHCKNESSQVNCKVTIMKLITSDSFEFYNEIFGNIIVELEQGLDFLKEGMKVSFTGSLRINL